MNHGLKSFLLSSQTKLIEGLIEEVEGMKAKEECDEDKLQKIPDLFIAHNAGRNSALQKVIDYLKEGIKV